MLYRPIEIGDCAGGIATFQKEHAAVVIRVRVSGIQPYGFIVIGQRVLEISAVLMRIPTIIERVSCLRVQANSFCVVANREVEVTSPAIGNSAVHECAIVTGIQKNG